MIGKIPIRELIRLAMYYAENDRREFVRCTREGSTEQAEALNEAAQFLAYRMKHYGQTKGEAALSDCHLIDARTGERVTKNTWEALK